MHRQLIPNSMKSFRQHLNRTSSHLLRRAFDRPSSLNHSTSPPHPLFKFPFLGRASEFPSCARATVVKCQQIVDEIISISTQTFQPSSYVAAKSHGSTGDTLANFGSSPPPPPPHHPRQIIKMTDMLSDRLCAIVDTAEVIRHVHPEREWVEAAESAYELLNSFISTLNTHRGLFQVFCASERGKPLNYSPGNRSTPQTLNSPSFSARTARCRTFPQRFCEIWHSFDGKQTQHHHFTQRKHPPRWLSIFTLHQPPRVYFAFGGDAAAPHDPLPLHGLRKLRTNVFAR